MLSLSLSVFLIFLMCPLGSSGQNIPCMLLHCADESKNCMLDSDCRSALACITGCGTKNETCMFDCLYSYEDDVFDTFMKCAFTEHKCITMVSPDPDFRCKPPHAPLKTLNTQQLKGSWYIVLGLNPNFDCFDCQITTFYPTNSSNILHVNERFDVHTIDGNLRHSVVNETALQNNASFQGVLEYKGMQMGHETTTDWRILYQDPKLSYMIGYYCGHVASDWYYEGAVVFSRNPQISEIMAEIKGHMTSLGLPVDQFCAPKTLNCLQL